MANFFKKHPKLWLFFLLKPKSETPYNIASPLKNFLLKGHYECNCCTSTSLLLLIDGIIFKGYDTLEFQADIPATVTCIHISNMELQHDWNLWCTQKLSFKMKLKQLSRYLIINNTPGCPVLHTGSIYIFITKALHIWNAFYISTCTDPVQSTVSAKFTDSIL